MSITQTIYLNLLLFTLLKPVWIPNYALILYNALICVLNPFLFLRDSFIVPRLKNRSTGVLRGRFSK